MKGQHTKEPWIVENQDHVMGNSAIMSQSGWVACAATREDLEAALKSNEGLVNAETNAQRIVDCVNACAGLNPLAVPKLLKACQQAAKEIYVLMSELGDDPNKVGCYNQLNQAIAEATKEG